MSEIKKNFEPKVGSERSFGYTFCVFFLLFFLFSIYHNNGLNYYLLLISIFFFIVTFIKPSFFKKPNLLWFKLGMLIGSFISPIVMTLIYVITILPVGIILKLFNKDVMNIKIKKSHKSYWINKNNKKYRTMRNQF